jgi:hypothetical protein
MPGTGIAPPSNVTSVHLRACAVFKTVASQGDDVA